MTCEEDLATTRRWIDVYRTTLTVTQQQISMVRGWIGALSDTASQQATTTAQATTSDTPTRQATTAQAEQRATNSDMAAVAALLRDIEDMEARLDRLEAR